MLSVPRN